MLYNKLKSKGEVRMKYCSKCGKENQDNTTFCSACGAPLNAENNAQNNPQANYQQQNYQNPPVMGTPVDTNRSLLIYILLSILTCGIYGYYFIYKLAKDVNQMCREDGDHIGGLLAYIFLSIITCGIYSYYWLYKIQNRLHNAAYRYGVVVPENGTTVLVWLLFGSLLCGLGSLYAFHIVFKSANSVGMAYNAKMFGYQR